MWNINVQILGDDSLSELTPPTLLQSFCKKRKGKLARSYRVNWAPFCNFLEKIRGGICYFSNSLYKKKTFLLAKPKKFFRLRRFRRNTRGSICSVWPDFNLLITKRFFLTQIAKMFFDSGKTNVGKLEGGGEKLTLIPLI